MHAFIKAFGAGQKRARPLDRAEARAAMALVARGEAEPVQVGAFLLALRMKGETAEELAGFCDAFAALAPRAPAPAGALEVDAHGDGHEGVPSLLPAAACAAAALGTPVALALDGDNPQARHGLDQALAALGLEAPLPAGRAARDLGRAGVAATRLDDVCPALHALCRLRPLLGVRTAAQTVAKLVSPLAVEARLIGVFHAPYLEPTARAAALAGARRGAVVQQLGGLPEATPGKKLRVAPLPGATAGTLDLLPLAGAELPAEAAPAANLAALAGQAPWAERAAASAGLMLWAATGADPVEAARQALRALRDGAARAQADRLRA